jgi:ribonuclease P protein component
VPARTVGRITTRAAFADVQRARCRGASGPVRAAFVPVDEQEPGVFPQVGYSIGRQCGGAVVRNRLRRRMREAARQCAPDLRPGRYLVRLDAAAASTPAADLRAHAVAALRRASTAGDPSLAPAVDPVASTRPFSPMSQ